MAYKTLVILSLFLCFVSQSFAEVASGGGAGCDPAINCTVTTGTASSTSTTPTGTVNDQMTGAVTTTTNYGTDGSVGEEDTGAYNQANSGKTQSIVMGVAAAALGASYMSRCGTFNQTACYLGAAAFAAAGYAASKAMQSQDLMNDLGTSGSSTGTVDTSTVQDAALQKELNKLKADLVSQGYTVDDSGFDSAEKEHALVSGGGQAMGSITTNVTTNMCGTLIPDGNAQTSRRPVAWASRQARNA